MSHWPKNNLLISIVAIVLFLTGCSSEMAYLPINDGDSPVTNRKSNVSKEDAIAIANKVLKKDITRGTSFELPRFEYVLAENATRSTLGIDTLAYILNYPHNEGFVIVAADRRVYPVLGFLL